MTSWSTTARKQHTKDTHYKHIHNVSEYLQIAQSHLKRCDFCTYDTHNYIHMQANPLTHSHRQTYLQVDMCACIHVNAYVCVCVLSVTVMYVYIYRRITYIHIKPPCLALLVPLALEFSSFGGEAVAGVLAAHFGNQIGSLGRGAASPLISHGSEERFVPVYLFQGRGECPEVQRQQLRLGSGVHLTKGQSPQII